MKQGTSHLTHQIQLGDSVIAHVSQKPGPPIICLHGFGGSGLDFDALATHLIREHRIIGLNLPGHGGVEFNDDPRPSIVNAIHTVCHSVRAYGVFYGRQNCTGARADVDTTNHQVDSHWHNPRIPQRHRTARTNQV